MQEELRQVLSIFRSKKSHYNDSMNRDPVLDHYSTPREVQNWLIAKGFSEKVCKQLRDMTGSDVFNLTKRQLEQHCDVGEGSKLYSQISLARVESEKNRQRPSELKQILAKARHRAED
ncbi:epidermal growth factor receptor kinase substrate 8-like [Ceratina calcarata]|uniref:Epidermal growth factor receptor kinase substrate 8-like n=1 Tax=Ceratina calcarata TaxID=156304 RepID=A0AAJ7RZ66_9HYME|nr:epidermal growth factor receptor kinase substrate 8-like [Ceratina calcarata]